MPDTQYYAYSVMGSEDFAHYLKYCPGAYFGIVIGSGGSAHSPDYEFNDEAIPIIVNVYKELLSYRFYG
jgi:metal-dependent amidase/aminoacylase/carboxypeptidase family protein